MSGGFSAWRAAEDPVRSLSEPPGVLMEADVVEGNGTEAESGGVGIGPDQAAVGAFGEGGFVGEDPVGLGGCDRWGAEEELLASDGDVVVDGVGVVVIGEAGEGGVALEVAFALDGGGFEGLGDEGAPAGVAPRGEAHGGGGVDEEVGDHEVFLAAVDLDAAEVGAAGGAALEDVALDEDPADGVVEADAGALAVGGVAGAIPGAEVMPVVVAEDISAVGGVAEHIDRALVIGFEDDAVGFVAFDEVIVAFDAHGAAGDVMDEVVAEGVADAVEPDARGVGVIDA